MIALTRQPVGRIVTRTNEITNPSFETGTTGWGSNGFGTGGAGTDMERPNIGSAAVSGSYAVRKTFTTAPSVNTGAGFWYYNAPWFAGSQKQFSAYVWTTTAQQFAVYIVWLDSYGNSLGIEQSPLGQGYAGAWSRLSYGTTAPAKATQANILVEIVGGTPMAANSQFYVDAALLESVVDLTAQIGNYFDGSTATVGDGQFAWTGTAHASTSTQTNTDANAYIQPLQAMDIVDSQQASRSVVQQLLGGPVAATLYPTGLRTGILRLAFTSSEAADAARRGLAVAGAWVYRDTDNPRESMTFVVAGPVRKYQLASRVNWAVEVSFAEISA